MSRLQRPQPLALAIAVLGGVTVLVLSSLAMSAVVRPKDYDARLAALNQSVAEIERSAPASQVQVSGESTFCGGSQLAAAPRLRDDLVKAAGAAGMTVKLLDVLAGARSANLAAIDVSFTVEGPYDGAVRLIGALQASQPEVFVDSVDLAPGGGGFSLKVKGRAFCWISARP